MIDSLKYLDLILGWLFGIISTLLINYLDKRSNRVEVSTGILAEIDEVKHRMAGISYLSTLRTQSVTKEWSDWVRPYRVGFAKLKYFDYLLLEDESSELIKDFTPEEYFNLLDEFSHRDRSQSSLTLAPVKLNYLDSKISSLGYFNEIFQQSLYILKKDIDLLNYDFDQLWYYHKLTFDGLIVDNNRSIVVTNINLITKRISIRAKSIVTLIEKIEKHAPTKRTNLKTLAYILLIGFSIWILGYSYWTRKLF